MFVTIKHLFVFHTDIGYLRLLVENTTDILTIMCVPNNTG